MRSDNRRGFTLIELIIVVGIIILLAGTSIAAYFRFSQRQAALNDARNFSTKLREVQAMAKNLVYPANCSGLVGYRLVADDSGYTCETCQTVSAYAICSQGEIIVPEIDKEKVLTKAFFSDPVNIVFTAGSGAVNQEAVGTYFLSNNVDFSNQVVVVVDKNGVISMDEVTVTPTPTP